DAPAAPHPVPSLSALTPTAAAAGAAGVPLIVSGGNFDASSVVQWNGASRPTTFASDTELKATILASDLAVAGAAQVTVLNSSQGGGTSNALTFTIAQWFAVAVVRAGSGSGTVTSTPSGISC